MDFINFTDKLKNTKNSNLIEAIQCGYNILHESDDEGGVDESKQNFIKWFGNSKIVNSDGSPKVVYHGSANSFDEFITDRDGNIFLTDSPEVANSYSEWKMDQMDGDDYQNGFAIYLKIENPLVVDYEDNFWEDYPGVGLNLDGTPLREDQLNEDGDPIVDHIRSQEVPDWGYKARKNGFDGVIIKNVFDTNGYGGDIATTYIVFDPNQIKSVYNKGTWSTSTNKITE
jgi:hypothetical protein